MMSLVEMDMGFREACFRNVYGWPGWIIEVDLHVDPSAGGWTAGAVRCTPPPRTRRNARRPTDDPELVTRLRHVAEGRHGVPGFVALGLPTPHKKKKDSVRLRAVTIATMFETAREQGFSPRRVISAVYGLRVVDEGNRTLYSPKMHRWIRQARTTKNLRTGKPYLLRDPDGDAPKRWPGSRGKHPLEPRRARPMLEDPPREGPYAGRTLTLIVTRTPPPTTAEGAPGRCVGGADLIVVGRWNNGQTLPQMLLREINPGEAPQRVVALIKDLEHRYPAAKITATMLSTTG